jgi:hypothetical protein
LSGGLGLNGIAPGFNPEPFPFNHYGKGKFRGTLGQNLNGWGLTSEALDFAENGITFYPLTGLKAPNDFLKRRAALKISEQKEVRLSPD